MFNTKIDRLTIVLDLSKKLKNFKGQNGEMIDLYNGAYSFSEEFKKICNEYLNQDDTNVVEFRGVLKFEEIGRNIEYVLPAKTHKKPLLVIRRQ